MQVQSLFRMQQPYRHLKRQRWAASLIQVSWKATLARRQLMAIQAVQVIQRCAQLLWNDLVKGMQWLDFEHAVVVLDACGNLYLTHAI